MKNSWDTILPIVICGIVGMVGVCGESYALHNSLVHSYPYKMMNMPPSEFYSRIGIIGYYTSLSAAVISLASIKWVRSYLIPVVPVIVCPLTYWRTFEIAFIFSGFSRDDMLQRNFEGYTGQTARYEFGFEVLGLIFWGAIGGLVAGFLINKIFSLLFKSPTAT